MRDYQNKSNVGAVPDSNAAEKYGASEVNSLRNEAKTAVERAGLTLAPQNGVGEDTTQLAQSLFINGVGAASFQAAGTANAITLTPVTGSAGLLLPPDYSTLDGAEVSFYGAFANTGATTISIGQTSGTQFGVKDLVRDDGSALQANDISTVGLNRARFSVADDQFTLVKRGKLLFPATEAEQKAGTLESVFVTPANQQFHQSAAKAWVSYNQIGNTVNESYNVTSVTDNSVGNFTVNFTNTFSTGLNYTVVGMTNSSGLGGSIVQLVTNTAVSATFQVVDNTGALIDASFIGLAFFGELV